VLSNGKRVAWTLRIIVIQRKSYYPQVWHDPLMGGAQLDFERQSQSTPGSVGYGSKKLEERHIVLIGRDKLII